MSPTVNAKIWLTVAFLAVEAGWTYRVVRPAKAGWQRFALSGPFLILNFLIPAIFDPRHDAPVVNPLAGILCMAAFQLFTFCWGRGTLSHPWSARQFVTLMMLPMVPRSLCKPSKHGRAVPPPRSAVQIALDSVVNLAALLAISLLMSWGGFPKLVKYWLFGLAASNYLGFLNCLAEQLVRRLLGVDLMPSFDRPWLSDSFQDFWSHRWNFPVSHVLRAMIYEPVVEGQLLAASLSNTTANTNRDTSRLRVSDEPAGGGLKSEARTQEYQYTQEPSAVMTDQEVSCGTDSASATVPNGVGMEHHAKKETTMPCSQADVSDNNHGHQYEADALVAPTYGVQPSTGSTTLVTGHTTGPPAYQHTDQELVNDATSPSTTTANAHHRTVTPARKYLALQATFLFSGLWHVLTWWYITRTVSWRWGVFFVVQAPILVAERQARLLFRRLGITLPRRLKWLQIVWTHVLMVAVAGPLFCVPVERAGFFRTNLASVQKLLNNTRVTALYEVIATAFGRQQV